MRVFLEVARWGGDGVGVVVRGGDIGERVFEVVMRVEVGCSKVGCSSKDGGLSDCLSGTGVGSMIFFMVD